MQKISIITVNLNNLAGFIKTIQSVASQTYTNKEYIIIDGGSIDGSIDIIKKNATEITYWLSEPDGGIYDAMNKGIAVAKGEWIIFMNSGDKFHDNRTLEIIFNDRKFDNIDIIYGNTLYKDTNKLLIAPDNITKRFFFNKTLCHQSILTNRESFKKIGNYNLKYKFISDKEWLLRAEISKLNFQFVNEIISEWDPEGFCKSNTQLVLKEVNIMKKLNYKIYEIVVYHTLNKAINFLRKLF